jgi:hypothetical protein
MVAVKQIVKTISTSLILFTALLHAPRGWAEMNWELLLFPQVELDYRSGLNEQSDMDDTDASAGVDLYLTLENGQFRLLSEYLVSTHELDFERLQLGWLVGDNLYWLGRFHTPLGYWNNQYHHGYYLQTSISRPAIIEYEEHGGVLPMHQVGFFADGKREVENRSFGYSLALGAGPEYTGELEAMDVLSPGEAEADFMAALNFYVDLNADGASKIGAFVSYATIPSSTQLVNEIDLRVFGLYGNWQFARWNLHGSAFYIKNSLDRPDEQVDGSFVNAYLQAELIFSERWMAFGRVEQSASENGDPYLALFPHFIKERVLGGVRFDFNENNALKFEVSNNQSQNDDYVQFGIQWSAQF